MLDARGDLRATLGEIGDHIGAAQVFGVVGRRRDAHVVVGVEAVAAGDPTGPLGEDFAVDHRIAEQHHQPLARTHEFGLARAPAHALGDRQLVQRGFDDARQQADGGLAGNALAEFQLRPAAVDLGQVDAAFLGEAQRRLGRITVLVEGRLQRRAIEVLGAIGLLFFELLDQHREAPRRGVVAHLAIAQAGGLQAFFDAGEEGLAQAVQGFRRQLFGAQFYQKIVRTHSAASSLASTSSRRSGAASGKPSLRRACR
ncbi:hypothetical protein D3C84_627000 [compost metagenome]